MLSDRIPQSPPVILPVPEGEHRPLWSVMIPTYNCIRFLKNTLESVLAQAPDADLMQIEVIDDYSTDGDVEALVKEVGQGRVGFYRQPENRGSLRNFETCVNRSRGHYVHILHGDDMIMPGFYDAIKSLFDVYPEIGAAFCDHKYISEGGEILGFDARLQNEPGIVKDWLYHIAKANRVQPPAKVVKRSTYEKLGSFYAVHYGEDWEMWVRIAANFPVAHTPEHLARYRVHSTNITSRSFLSGQNIRDVETVIGIIKNYLPPAQQKQLAIRARRNFSRYFAVISNYIYSRQNNREAAMLQAKQSLRMHFNAVTVHELLILYFKLAIKYQYKDNPKGLMWLGKKTTSFVRTRLLSYWRSY